jgi:hypothetical protein
VDEPHDLRGLRVEPGDRVADVVTVVGAGRDGIGGVQAETSRQPHASSAAPAGVEQGGPGDAGEPQARLEVSQEVTGRRAQHEHRLGLVTSRAHQSAPGQFAWPE